MKIALLGYGKMGKMIEKIALSRGHRIIAKIGVDSPDVNIEGADVGIDFSVPSAALNNISLCLNKGIPVISGTTGWLENKPKAEALCREKNGAFIHATNFSLGVNIFFQLNEYLAKIIGSQPQYSVSIEEIHHTQKLDAPSGTAITLAEGIINNTSKTGWALENATEDKIPITAKRLDAVPGTHTVSYNSNVDTLSITHVAHNREGFALGAVIAAEWILGKKGVFTMKDVLNLP